MTTQKNAEKVIMGLGRKLSELVMYIHSAAVISSRLFSSTVPLPSKPAHLPKLGVAMRIQ